MSALTLIIVILLIMLILGAPAWPYSRGWGYGPSGLIGAILIILVIFLLLGRV